MTKQYSIIELSEDGTMKVLYPTEEVVSLQTDDQSAPRTIIAYTVYNDYVDIRKMNDEQIELSRHGRKIVYTKSTEEEVNEQIQKAEEAEAHEQIHLLMEGYISNFADAVNYGNIYYIDHYMKEGSNLYNEQEKFVERAYEENIGE